jgi:hypothetical protein
MARIRFTLEDQQLDYQFLDNELAGLWLNLAAADGSWPRAQSVAVALPQRRDQLVSQLDSVCLALGLESRDLNDLHLKFQQSGSHCDPLWAHLNNTIHQLEHQGRDLGYAWIKFSLPIEFPRHEIDPALRPYWAHTLSDGDLCLGYHTVGKTLWHCFWDDDPLPVRQGQLSPQMQLSSELLLRIGGRPRPLSTQWPRLLAWLDYHDLTDCVNPWDPQHRYPGQPLLARQQGSVSADLLARLTAYSEPRDICLTVTDK